MPRPARPHARSPAPRPDGVRYVALQVAASVAFGQRLLHGVADYAREHGREGAWRVHYHPHAADFDYVPEPCDGVIRHVRSDAEAADLLSRGLAVVGVLSRRYDDPSAVAAIPHVSGDDAAVGRLVADHLLARGLRHFGHYPSPSTGSGRQRRDGFAARLAEAGRGLADHAGDPRDLAARADWLRGLPRPCGLMAYNDLEGRAVLSTCRDIGLHAPDDVAVVGVDDDPLLCAFSSPPLSSVVTGTRRIGYLAAGLLDRLMGGAGRPPEPRPPDPPPVPPLGVVTRQSSDVLAVDDPDVADALRHIRDHACDPGGLSVDAVADRAGVGRRRLEQKFRRALGVTPLAEVRRVRMNRAAELLGGTSLPVGVVARRCGYSAQSRFGVDFRATWGETPAGYRRARRTPLE